MMIRSPKYLAAAKGQPCTLRFIGICLDPYGRGHETTVFAHFRFGKGGALKADDIDGCDACFNCHAFLDVGWAGKISQSVMLEHMARGKAETQRNRFERGLLIVPQAVQNASARPAKPRKPKEQRVAIQSASNWPKGQKIQSKNTLRRTKEPTR